MTITFKNRKYKNKKEKQHHKKIPKFGNKKIFCKKYSPVFV